MDALLWFDCLMYINSYYYFMFTIANFAIWTAKNTAPESDYSTPNIVRDAYFAASLTISELLKLLLFRRYRNRYQDVSIIMAVSFSMISLLALLYVFIIQWPVLKLEYSLDAMLFMLLVGEVIYGVYSFLPCCTAPEY